MKSLLWMLAGFAAAAVGLIVWGPQRTRPVQELAQRLEAAWSDHRTIA